MDAAVLQATGDRQIRMSEMYTKYWRPFGLLLTDMEKEGMSVNRYVLKDILEGTALNALRTVQVLQLLICTHLYVACRAPLVELHINQSISMYA